MRLRRAGSSAAAAGIRPRAPARMAWRSAMPSTLSGQSAQVTMTSATPDAAIYYTVDSTTPTAASQLYGGPVAIGISAVVKAIAVSPTLGTSLPVTVVYTGIGAPPNDNFANAAPISGTLPFEKYDDNYSATAQAGEPHHAGVSALKTV